MSEFHERLKTLREQASITPQELADITHVSLASQYNYEKGTRKPDIEYLTCLHEAGFDVVYLLTGERNVAFLSEEDRHVLQLWHQANQTMREASLVLLAHKR